MFDAALPEKSNAIGERHRFFLIVRDKDERDADLALQILQLQLHLAAQIRIESRERLIEQQHTRAVDQRSGESNALLLPAAELRRLSLRELGHVHLLERHIYARYDL